MSSILRFSFAIRVPPQYEDATGPRDYSAGLCLCGIGDKAKLKTYAARIADPDGKEALNYFVHSAVQDVLLDNIPSSCLSCHRVNSW
ncbi:hypothetical protein Scep_018960 [Stephania cephalantha]|uniref:Uncharacterized protein n=1 Tax=Stephania cephalantha TaxID=152367 RepID=A0AAP0I9U4_9MAGN